MNNETTLLEYRINRNGGKFVAMDSEDEVVGAYDTEDEAKRDIERAKFEDAIYKHSKILFHAAIATVMNAFDVDRESARYWVATAAGADNRVQVDYFRIARDPSRIAAKHAESLPTSRFTEA